MKRIALMFLACFCLYSVPALAAGLDGSWKITGKANLKGSLPGYLTIDMKLLKNKDVSDTLTIESGEFTSEALGGVGSIVYDQRGNATVDLTALLQQMEAEIATMLPEAPVITYTNKALQMKAKGKGKIGGTLSVACNVQVNRNNPAQVLALTLSYVFDGTRNVVEAATVGKSTGSTRAVSTFVVEKALRPLARALSAFQ
jgi:hypothetical protein